MAALIADGMAWERGVTIDELIGLSLRKLVRINGEASSAVYGD